MYILVMLYDSLDSDDIFVDSAWFNTLKDAVDEGRRRCVEDGDHFQILKPIPCSTEMDIIPEEKYE